MLIQVGCGHSNICEGATQLKFRELCPHLLGSLFLAFWTAFYFYFFINLFIYFWLSWLFVAAHGLSVVVASRGYSSLWCAGFSSPWLLLLRSTGSRLRGMWDLPGPGLEPVSPALAGGFLTTAPPGKPWTAFYNHHL